MSTRPSDTDLLQGMMLALVCAAVLLVVWVLTAHAQEMHHRPEDMPMHERFYSTWMQPDNREASCCGNGDCYATEFKQEGGTWFFKDRDDGQWHVIPANKLEWERDNPDGRNHICHSPGDTQPVVYCAIIGGGM